MRNAFVSCGVVTNVSATQPYRDENPIQMKVLVVEEELAIDGLWMKRERKNRVGSPVGGVACRKTGASNGAPSGFR